MKPFLFLTLILCVSALSVGACAPRLTDPAQGIPLNKQRERQLLGAWELRQLQNGSAPQPQERRTLTFQDGNHLQMDLWEHRLTFRYEVMPDPDHLRLTWVSSTNPNDTPWQVLEQPFSITGDDLILNGDRYKRVALANGATITPLSPAALTSAAAPMATLTAIPAATVSPSPTRAAPPPNGLPTMKLDESFRVRVYQTVWLPDAQMQVTVNGVWEDSRCPRNVNCVQAGRARLGLTVVQDTRLGVFALSTMPPDAQLRAYFRGYAIELLDVAPYPQNVGETIAPKDYFVTLIVHKTEAPTTARKNEAIVLKPGQSITLADEDVTLTFVRVQSDSRSPYGATCVQRGNGAVAITLRVGDQVEHSILDTDEAIAEPRGQTFGSVVVELLSLNPYPRIESANQGIAPDEYEAMFVVRKFASPQPTPTFAASAPAACLGMTADDARAILGTPVQPTPSPNVLVQVLAFGADARWSPKGLCGYVSAEKNSGTALPPRAARIVAPSAAAYAVTADRLEGRAVFELLRAFDILRAAVPDANDTLTLLLQTQLAAGDWDGVLETFETLARGADKIHAERVENLGTPAIWLWRSAESNNYTAFVAQTSRGLILVEALLPKTMTPAAAHEAFATLLPKLVQ
jgi:hypothetical protein